MIDPIKELVEQHLADLRFCLGPDVDLLEFLEDPGFPRCDDEEVENREAVAYEFGRLEGIAETMMMTILEMLDALEIPITQEH